MYVLQVSACVDWEFLGRKERTRIILESVWSVTEMTFDISSEYSHWTNILGIDLSVASECSHRARAREK